jgi:hypothetical protein
MASIASTVGTNAGGVTINNGVLVPGLNLPDFAAAVVALGLNVGAYNAEALYWMTLVAPWLINQTSGRQVQPRPEKVCEDSAVHFQQLGKVDVAGAAPRRPRARPAPRRLQVGFEIRLEPRHQAAARVQLRLRPREG